MRSRGFSLLEVLVAVAILGLALTVILSAEAGLYSASSHVEHETIAIGMARCKMGEVEEDLLRLGYPEVDRKEDGPCCENQTPRGVRCSWKVERVELPQPTPFGESDGGGVGGPGLDIGSFMGAASPSGTVAGMGAGAMGSPGGMLPSGTGAFGALFAAGANDAGALTTAGGADGGFQALSGMLGGAASQGVAGLAPLVMTIVYPSLKPMLEASIRKLTIVVKWREGVQEHDLTVVQYVTNPMRGGLNSMTAPEGSGFPMPGGQFGGGTSGGFGPPMGGPSPGNPFAPSGVFK